ncbi:MAG: iron-containing alcohol dehydrogenase [Phycisphaerae bacterium]|nr:iron-containing alcohol dehydrogenase [Phycisphaerae bacterium]
MTSTFTTAHRIVTGQGAFNDLGTLAARIGRTSLVVTGRRAMRDAGVTDRTLALLRAAGLDADVYEDVPPEPTIDSVDAGVHRLRQRSADVVIGIGGGSAIDAAKAIGGLAHADGDCATYFRGKALPKTGVPVIAVPTTAGTGAEVTPNSVLSDPATPTKQSIRGDALMPVVALVDPNLTVSMPPNVTARSGMDALTQAIESYWSLHATPITEGLALHAVKLIRKHLPKAFADGADMPAREAMAYASLMAGIAFANSRLGAVHGLAHPLGIRYHIPHGQVCAILLPHVMRLNRQAAPEKYDRLSHVVGGDAADVATGLLERLEIPATLKHVGLNRADFDAIVAESMPSGSLKANPKKVTEEDLVAILEALA